ncbi:MAG: glycoside hydrolase family 97 protein [Flavobacteriaceae bacterium]|nr:glycoside hydrolase family 97 protein [Flavobacteriaceae bacterium]
MKYLTTIVLITLLLSLSAYGAKPKVFNLSSPDGKLTVTFELKDKIYYTLTYKGQQIIDPSPISMTFYDGVVFGKNPVARNGKTRNVNENLLPLYGKRKVIHDHFNELIITFKGNYTVIARMYNEGFAYRFGSTKKGEIIVKEEEASFNFSGDYKIWSAHSKRNSFQHSYEAFYTINNLSQFPDTKAMLPILVQTDFNVSIAVTESDLEDYPGFHVVKNADSKHGLKAVFPKYPTSWEPDNNRGFNLLVTKRADFIAKTTGRRTFPWRIMKIATNDIQLLDTDLVYKLSDAHDENIDFSWVKPGKVAWDWWNALNLSGVDFKSGINTKSYKYFIDFAAENGIEYVNLDEGWSDQFDLMKLSDQINLKEIIDYGHEKGVGIFLWSVHYPLDEKLEEAMAQFKKLGVKGLKIDFMDRDDQVMVDYYHRISKAAAAHQLLVNFHGAYKPAGLHRKYPNVINREAVRGLEYNKFSKKGTTPEYAVTIPFIRMIAGPLDYTPGAMTNAQKDNFSIFFERPMSMGTRAQQLAMFVVYEAPLQMLADTPTAYEAEPEILEFLSQVPTVWDETVALNGKVGDYVVIARKSGNTWYVGGMTDWDARTLRVDFSFLEKGKFKAQIFQDGINADRIGNDYKKLEMTIDKNSKHEFKLAPGGGFVIKITTL